MGEPDLAGEPYRDQDVEVLDHFVKTFGVYPRRNNCACCMPGARALHETDARFRC